MIMSQNEEVFEAGVTGMKRKYLSILRLVKRDGIEELIDWLSNHTDFFTAPASARGHNNHPGGLVEHSLNVFFLLDGLLEAPLDIRESTILVSLLHDVCKVNFYKWYVRNKKIDGVWVQEPYISIEDKIPLGHGEKSVMLIQQFIDLTMPEMMAIRWHMGGFDDAARQFAGGLALTEAMDLCPLIIYLHCADLLSTIPEEKTL